MIEWQPIEALGEQEKYDGLFLLSAPELLDEDYNPDGVHIGHWADDEGWKSVAWNNSQDYSYDILIHPTHFARINRP